ncbi:MAG: tRNA (N(6)-L-threonylcarbamoyladenosine(37)-C(2))-methylthiotransferase MtaB [Bacteroidales bacterium]|nr:tRNA (N(6)-L-threonylcarbamoyladenosine(37)-C(2))-methylthiotransferase MtaB [Bacteroidales bacterium]
MKELPKAAFITFGCKLNYSETSEIAKSITESGFQRVKASENPDVFIINTCLVTKNAESKCRRIIGQITKASSKAFVVVVGCYSQMKAEEIAAISGVDMVMGNKEKHNLAGYLTNIEKKIRPVIINSDIKIENNFTPSCSVGDRTRSFLKIQDGCDYFCSYCVIPHVRGRSRSDTVKNIVENAKQISATGVKEIVLTGVNIGNFGAGTNEKFYDLIKELDKIDDVERLRISSIEPNLLTNEIIEFVSSSKKFLPHFHIPLQSGSNKILKLMNRKYEKEFYGERVRKIKSIMPQCCVATDVIVGFPSETENDFMETYDFLDKLDVSYMHVFTYSERENTTALKIGNIVPVSERTKRSRTLHELSDKKKKYFYEQQRGKIAEVLFESKNNDGFIYGFTENYVKIKAAFNAELINKIVKVKLREIADDFIYDVKL